MKLYLFLILITSIAQATDPGPEFLSKITSLPLFHGDETKTTGYTWKKCEDSTSRGLYTKKISPFSSELNPNCRPDTLYSWGSLKKLKAIEEVIGNNWKPNSPFRQIYTSTSAVGTFGYGKYAIRIKLKPNIKYKLIFDNYKETTCYKLSKKERENSLLVRAWKYGSLNGVDYIICSSNIIASWSYGTSSHYDEMLKELRWVLDPNHDIHDFKLYAQLTISFPASIFVKHPCESNPQCFKKRFHFIGSTLDGNDHSEFGLLSNLEIHKTIAEQRAGKIYVNPDISQPYTEADHFSTSLPTFFNEE